MDKHGNNMLRAAALSACLALVAGEARAQFKYRDCPDVADADFKLETLVSNATNPETSEPLKMDFALDAAGNVDVAPNGDLSGRVSAELGTKTFVVARGTLSVTGNLKSPLLRP